MLQVSVEEASQNLQALLDKVAQGEVIQLVESQGRAIALLTPITPVSDPFVAAQQLRSSIQVKGEPLSTTIMGDRSEERY
ncbi:MAG: type II toxin-antitoxin system Phd/YefM family antitoxin [Elainellaceae cyanobacterium]